jgi:hypothetical protein
VPGDDLQSLPGLQENHRRALSDKLGITSLPDLADADPRVIYTALGTLRSRPSLARIAIWQDEARGRLGDAATDESDWHTVASFAVIFAQRQVDGVWEQQIEAEQTEVEPEPAAQQWPSWDCGPVCDWMLGQVGLAAGQAAPEADQADPRAAAEPVSGERAELRIDSATITDAAGELELVRAGQVVAAPPDDLRFPVRLSLTVRGGQSGQQLRAVAWFRRPAAPGWSPQAPVILASTGQAEFDLSSVPPGPHNVRLLAWATEPGATLAAVTLPTLAFAAGEQRGGDLVDAAP